MSWRPRSNRSYRSHSNFGAIRVHNNTGSTPQLVTQKIDDAKEIKGWEKKTLARLTSLYLDEKTSDVSLINFA